MMRNIIARMLMVTTLLLFMVPATATAQEETPPANENEGVIVRGVIMNRTTGDPAPEGLNLMLHAWDESGSPRGMVHGVSGSGGTFELEDVIVEKGVFYAVMVTFNRATYFSDPVEALEDGELEPIEVAVYDTTTDSSDVKIDFLYLITRFDQGGLSVTEIYGLSNLGNLTIDEAITLEDGKKATLKVSLPAVAANVSFPSASADRYILFEGGFADTQPLVPGEGKGQITAIYVLPYDGNLKVSRGVPFETDEVIVFLPHEAGLSLEVEGAEYQGVKTLGGGAEAYEAYNLGQQSAGEQFELTFSGDPQSPSLAESEDLLSSKQVDQNILFGGVTLGVALIVFGLWMRRRDDAVRDEDLEDDPQP